MDEEFVRQMERITEHLLRHMGLAPPSPAWVKEEPPSLPRCRVKREPTSPLRRVNEEYVSSRATAVASRLDVMSRISRPCPRATTASRSNSTSRTSQSRPRTVGTRASIGPHRRPAATAAS